MNSPTANNIEAYQQDIARDGYAIVEQVISSEQVTEFARQQDCDVLQQVRTSFVGKLIRHKRM